MSILTLKFWNDPIKFIIRSVFAGGMRYARKNFNNCSVASVQYIHIVDHQGVTTMHTVRWPIRATFGRNHHGIGYPDPNPNIRIIYETRMGFRTFGIKMINLNLKSRKIMNRVPMHEKQYQNIKIKNKMMQKKKINIIPTNTTHH